jgi:predicted transposase/invertase (TIGR01784 family)
MFNKFLDPKNDVAFKKIFGTEKNKDILIHFLNDVLTFKDNRPITSVTFLKTVQDPETAAKKTSIVDILCQDEKGNYYIVEMQVAKEKGFEKRAQYYASKAYISQASHGGAYHNLKEIIFLAIADFVIFPQKTDYKSDHVTLDKKTYENDLKDFSFTFIELPKFQKDIEHLNNMTDKWIYFFKHADETSEQEALKIIGDSEIIEKAYRALNRLSWNDEELLSYDQSEKYEGVYLASMAQKFDEGVAKGIEQGVKQGVKQGIEQGVKQGIEQGVKQGIEQGVKQGVKQGIEQGIEQGVKQGVEKSKIDIARTLIEKKYQLDTIADITGLKVEKITQLMREKNKS